MIWLRSLSVIGAGLGVALACAWLFGDTVAARWLALYFAGYALIQTSYLARLNHWAALPRMRDVPLGSGAWGIVLDRLGRVAKSSSETRTELTAELAQIHAAVDRLPDGLVVLDRFDHVAWCNNAAAELHGIFGVARPLHLFIQTPEFLAYMEGSDYSRPPVLTLAARPGRLFELQLQRTGEGSKLLITRDITEHATLDAMRRDFVANVSHEFRTPVTVIGGFAETLLNLDLDLDTRREYLGNILRQSQTLQRLVEDLLMLSSLENSAAQPVEEPVDVHALVNMLIDEARTISQGRHTFSMVLDAPPMFRAVPAELESAVRNLITNAIRYTPDGGRIDVEWRYRDDEAWLTVRDTGIGIAPEHIPRLTERFYRVDRGRSRDSGGTGLGLAIVKHVLQRCGGRLHVESTPGHGSAFALRMPASRQIL